MSFPLQEQLQQTALVSRHKTTTLQALALQFAREAHPILASLQSNGTLFTVPMPGKKESPLAESYSLRNQHIGAHLETLTSDESDQGQDTTHRRSKPDRGSMSLYPTLLQCANQVSTTGTSTTLSTLMNLSDSIGF
jgi:hypothetical protein